MKINLDGVEKRIVELSLKKIRDERREQQRIERQKLNHRETESASSGQVITMEDV